MLSTVVGLWQLIVLQWQRVGASDSEGKCARFVKLLDCPKKRSLIWLDCTGHTSAASNVGTAMSA